MAVQRFAVGVRVRPPIDRNNERFDVEAAAKADEFTVLLSNLGGRAFLEPESSPGGAKGRGSASWEQGRFRLSIIQIIEVCFGM